MFTNLAQLLGTSHRLEIQAVHNSGQQGLQQRKHVNPTLHTIAWFSQQLFNSQLVKTERVLQANFARGHFIQRFQHIHTPPELKMSGFSETAASKFDIIPNWLLINGVSLPHLKMHTSTS